MPEPPISIVIADDHPIFRAGLQRLLETEPDLRVVGEARNGVEALERVARLTPDILLLDVSMPELDGLETLRHLAQETLRVRTILLTAAIESVDMTTALRLGALGVLQKTSTPDLLFRCLRAVMRGQYWVGRDVVRTLVQALAEATRGNGAMNPATITPRERDVVAAVARGATNKGIAQSLGVSEQTVKNHLSSIFDKTGVSSRLELALYAQREHLAGHSGKP
jgi:two-component system, NarL family, nitrate/nitrite response regulator NarL